MDIWSESGESDEWTSDDGIDSEYGHHNLDDNISDDSNDWESDDQSQNQQEIEEEMAQAEWHLDLDDYEEPHPFPWVSYRHQLAPSYLP